MANTEEEVLGQQDEEGTDAMKDEGDKDPERDISQPSLHESVGTDKPNVAPGEVMSLRECCRDAFGKMTEYLRGELSGSLEDYVLLEKLNKLTVTKYVEMSDTAKTLITAMEELDKKYKSLEPYLEQIDKVEESVASLEQAAYRLDAYSKRLEAKFKKLERR